MKIGDKVRIKSLWRYTSPDRKKILTDVHTILEITENNFVCLDLGGYSGFLENLACRFPKNEVELVEKGDVEIMNKQVEIDKVYYNKAKRTTVIKFKNGAVSKVKASEGTEFDEYIGFISAYTKYAIGSNHQIKKIIQGADRVEKQPMTEKFKLSIDNNGIKIDKISQLPSEFTLKIPVGEKGFMVEVNEDEHDIIEEQIKSDMKWYKEIYDNTGQDLGLTILRITTQKNLNDVALVRCIENNWEVN